MAGDRSSAPARPIGRIAILSPSGASLTTGFLRMASVESMGDLRLVDDGRRDHGANAPIVGDGVGAPASSSGLSFPARARFDNSLISRDICGSDLFARPLITGTPGPRNRGPPQCRY